MDDNQGAASAETRTPNWHRAKIAQKRVRMKEGDRGGPAGTWSHLLGRINHRVHNDFVARFPSVLACFYHSMPGKVCLTGGFNSRAWPYPRRSLGQIAVRRTAEPGR